MDVLSWAIYSRNNDRQTAVLEHSDKRKQGFWQDNDHRGAETRHHGDETGAGLIHRADNSGRRRRRVGIGTTLQTVDALDAVCAAG